MVEQAKNQGLKGISQEERVPKKKVPMEVPKKKVLMEVPKKQVLIQWKLMKVQ